jgi:hypothetical protein
MRFGQSIHEGQVAAASVLEQGMAMIIIIITHHGG